MTCDKGGGYAGAKMLKPRCSQDNLLHSEMVEGRWGNHRSRAGRSRPARSSRRSTLVLGPGRSRPARGSRRSTLVLRPQPADITRTKTMGGGNMLEPRCSHDYLSHSELVQGR